MVIHPELPRFVRRDVEEDDGICCSDESDSNRASASDKRRQKGFRPLEASVNLNALLNGHADSDSGDSKASNETIAGEKKYVFYHTESKAFIQYKEMDSKLKELRALVDKMKIDEDSKKTCQNLCKLDALCEGLLNAKKIYDESITVWGRETPKSLLSPDVRRSMYKRKASTSDLCDSISDLTSPEDGEEDKTASKEKESLCDMETNKEEEELCETIFKPEMICSSCRGLHNSCIRCNGSGILKLVEDDDEKLSFSNLISGKVK